MNFRLDGWVVPPVTAQVLIKLKLGICLKNFLLQNLEKIFLEGILEKF